MDGFFYNGDNIVDGEGGYRMEYVLMHKDIPVLTVDLTTFHAYTAKPFITTHNKQIKYVQSALAGLYLDRLQVVVNLLMDEVYRNHELMTTERLSTRKELFGQRVGMLQDERH